MKKYSKLELINLLTLPSIMSILCIFIHGCGTGPGATAGGVQDIQAARALIEQETVPLPEAFLPEGMLSEFDLPIESGDCDDTLCLNAALGIAPDDKGVSSQWIQLGLSSSIDEETYIRPTVATVFCVDVSGSMTWDSEDNGSPGGIARQLLNNIAPKMNENDDVAIVTYGTETQTWLNFTPGGDPSIQNAINSIPTGGSTAMMAGLNKAYNVASQYNGNAEQVRVILFTDEQPNVGDTRPGSFRDLVEANGFKGIGMTIFGLGLGLDSELFSFMADVRGANAFSLSKQEQVPEFMENNWPWFVSPIAENLTVSTETNSVEFVEGYGFPGKGNTVEEAMKVQTVFLSKNDGALLLKFHSSDDISFPAGSGAKLTVTYEELDGSPRNQTFDVKYDGTALDSNGHYMPEPSVFKARSLVSLVEGMRESAEIYTGFSGVSPSVPTNKKEAQTLAVSTLTDVLERFDFDSGLINDPLYDAENEFWPKLLDLMKAGARQGELYGNYK